MVSIYNLWKINKLLTFLLFSWTFSGCSFLLLLKRTAKVLLTQNIQNSAANVLLNKRIFISESRFMFYRVFANGKLLL